MGILCKTMQNALKILNHLCNINYFVLEILNKTESKWLACAMYLVVSS